MHRQPSRGVLVLSGLVVGPPIPARPPLSVSSTWNWQLQGDLDTSVDADVYDIDLFDKTPAVIDALRLDARFVICYFSAGSYEPDNVDGDTNDTGFDLTARDMLAFRISCE